MHLYVAWSLHSIINCEAVSEASLSSLISKRNTLFEELSYLLPGIEESRKYGTQLALRVRLFEIPVVHTFPSVYVHVLSSNECMYFSPNECKLQSCRFALYLLKSGVCLGSQILTQVNLKY